MTERLLRGGRVLVDGTWHRHDVRIRDGRITAVGPDLDPGDAELVDLRGHRLAPGYLELQLNGIHGIDLTTEPERIWEVGTYLPRQGVAAFLPTIVSAPPDVVERARATLAAGPPPGWAGAVPLGLHVEGPMLAPDRRGAHDPAMLRRPDPDLVAGWSPDTGVALVTLAPELAGALEVVEALVAAGVVVSAGHTQASYEQTRRGIDAGITFATHLFNAMPALRGREPGAVAALLADPRVRVGCIADGVHLAPGTLVLAWQAAGPHRLVLVTDAMAATGLPEGRSTRLGNQDVIVREGRPTLPDGTLAGSVATLDGSVRHLVAVTGAPSGDVLRAVTANPAAVLGEADRGHLRPGARADLAVLDDGLHVVATLVGGVTVHDARGGDR